MTAKEKAQAIIDQLRAKGFTDDDISIAVIEMLKDMNK